MLDGRVWTAARRSRSSCSKIRSIKVRLIKGRGYVDVPINGSGKKDPEREKLKKKLHDDIEKLPAVTAPAKKGGGG